MSETDPIRAALAEAQAAIRPLIQAPGVVATRSVLRRRRVRRAAVLATFVVLALGLGAFAAAPTPTPSVPGIEWTTSAQPTGSPSLSRGASPSAITAPTGGSLGPCVPKLYPHVVNGGLFEGTTARLELSTGFPDAKYCPGVKYKFFWATYSYQPDGSQSLYASAFITLTADRMSAPTNVMWNTGPCGGDLYWVFGDLATVNTIPPGQHSPYPSWDGKRGVIESRRGVGSACVSSTTPTP